MSWSDVSALVAAGIATLTLLERVVGRLLRGKYATHAELIGMERALSGNDNLQSAKVRDVDHRVDLLVEQLKGLPDYNVVNSITSKLSELERVVAVSVERMSNIGDDVHETKNDVKRITAVLLKEVPK